jgi:hypothetical protein
LVLSNVEQDSLDEAEEPEEEAEEKQAEEETLKFLSI